MPSGRKALGSVTPRLWTPPLRELTPETSGGFAQIRFAQETLRYPFDPWQEWAVIHAGELLPDGRPRFRQVLLLAARQNGKSVFPVILSLYWQFVTFVSLILGTSTKLDYAKETWLKSVRLAERVAARRDAEGRAMAKMIPRRGWKRETNGEQETRAVDPDTGEESRYKIAASNAEGGRSLTVERLICDELRQHRDYTAWNAAEPATSAVWDAQIWALSNMGDDRSVVLNDLREQALEFIATGEGDPRLGLFEWSAPPGADPTDIDALAAANPNLGHRVDPDALLTKARAAVKRGGDALTGFRTEYMCQRVSLLDGAVDADAWRDCLVPGDLSSVRPRVATCLDISLDGAHATLCAAAVLPDGRARVEAVRAWAGADCVDQLRRELRGLLAVVRPRVLGWLPSGPAASLLADFDADRSPLMPRGVAPTEIRGDVAGVCMGFSEQVNARRLVHPGDPLLDSHVLGAGRRRRGDAWVFDRSDGGHSDAAYAAAGAVHLARTLPAAVGRPRLVVA